MELATINNPYGVPGNSQDASSSEESRAVPGSSPAFNHTRKDAQIALYLEQAEALATFPNSDTAPNSGTDRERQELWFTYERLYLCAAESVSGPDSRRRLAVWRMRCLSRRWRKLRTDIFRISAARV